MKNDFVCVEVSPHARAWAQPAADPHNAGRLFLAAEPTHEANLWDVICACDRADDEGHSIVRALGNHYDGHEVDRLLSASGIYARATVRFRRGEEPLLTPYALGLSVVEGCLVVRDVGGAFALQRCAPPDDSPSVPIPAALLGPKADATEAPPPSAHACPPRYVGGLCGDCEEPAPFPSDFCAACVAKRRDAGEVL